MKAKSKQIPILWEFVIGAIGIAVFVYLETFVGGSPMNDSILIERPPQDVFQALVDPNQITLLSQNIDNVELEASGLFKKGSSYKRVLYSHGMPNFQVVTVEEYEQNRLLTTRTTLVGFEVTYHYVLEATTDGKTLLTLKKDGEGDWLVFKPLLIHLLTRPEHDGGHLTLIKKVVEEQQR
ncbi:MAG: hypothetical protein U0Z26_14370 [Anaerolineales bacterium]